MPNNESNYYHFGFSLSLLEPAGGAGYGVLFQAQALDGVRLGHDAETSTDKQKNIIYNLVL